MGYGLDVTGEVVDCQGYGTMRSKNTVTTAVEGMFNSLLHVNSSRLPGNALF